MLGVANKLFMVSVVILSVRMLGVTKAINVVYRYSEYHDAECHK